jgi:hypothetical protein
MSTTIRTRKAPPAKSTTKAPAKPTEHQPAKKVATSNRPPGKKAAEIVQQRRKHGDTIKAIAEEMHTSATVRLLITEFLLAKAMGAGTYDKRYAPDSTEIIVNGAER